MNLFESRYFNLNRLLMSLLGLWPYQKLGFRRIKMIFISFFLVEAIAVQLASFITTEYSRNLLTKVFSFSFIVLICSVKYNMLYFNSEQVKYLFEQVLYDWHALTDAEEIEIIQRYANKGRSYTIFTGFFAYLGILTFVVLFFIPDILDIVAPLNEPRRHQLPLAIPIEYFFDQEKHIRFIILNVFVICFIAITILLAVETLYMICIQHACGLLKVTSYRILNAFDDRLQQMSTPKVKCTICINLSKAIKIHRRSLEFIEYVCSTFSVSYFILCIFGVASLSINLFEFLKAIESKDTDQAVYLGLFVYAQLFYLFWVNYFGQNLIDSSADVFEQTYNIQWYTVSTHIQKKILFILHRSSKVILFEIGNIFVFSLEGYAALINMSLSYCMLLYSTRT